MYTKDFSLPTEEELTVEEVGVSTPALRAAAFHMGKSCETENNEFMLCRQEEKDPRKCLEEGKAVTSCSMGFLRAIKRTCLEEFTQYAHCIDKSSKQLEYRFCRNTQSIFDKCVLDNLDLERPDLGYFCRPKILDTKRAKPEAEPALEFPKRAEPVAEEPVGGRARYGARYHWMS